MNDLMSEITKKIKRFLTTKDLLVFLFFLLLSTALWTLQALRKNYTMTVEMPINYVNLPQDYIITNELPTHIKLALEGRGSDLVRYRYGNVLEPLHIDMEEVVKGRKHVATTAYIGQIQKQIKPETAIRRVSPDSIHYSLEKQRKKVVSVELDAEIDLVQQYTLSDSIQISPSKITIYGPQAELNKLDTIQTEHLELSGIKDTVIIQAQLQTMRNVRYSDSIIEVKIASERFTEKSIQLPISTKNVPSNCTLRIFPSTATLSYQIGLSSYEKVDASSFSLYVDFQEARKNPKEKLAIKMHKKPTKAFNIKLKPECVECIIEEKSAQ